MQKTKLGLSVGFMGAILCCAGMFMGYTATILLAGYVILMEEDVWLKATAVKVVSIMTVFSLILAALSIVPGQGAHGLHALLVTDGFAG